MNDFISELYDEDFRITKIFINSEKRSYSIYYLKDELYNNKKVLIGDDNYSILIELKNDVVPQVFLSSYIQFVEKKSKQKREILEYISFSGNKVLDLTDKTS